MQASLAKECGFTAASRFHRNPRSSGLCCRVRWPMWRLTATLPVCWQQKETELKVQCVEFFMEGRLTARLVFSPLSNKLP